MWGQSVDTLIKEAKTKGEAQSPLRKSLRHHTPIYEYTAPHELGNGSIKILLHQTGSVWNKDAIQEIHVNHPELLPDAIVALNAGLGAYQSWQEVIFIATRLNIPFGVTEYAEQSLEMVTQSLVRSKEHHLSLFVDEEG